MKKSLSKPFVAISKPCKYKLDIVFSCFDVLTGEELNNLNILINDKLITEYTITETEVDGVIRYIYEILDIGPNTFTLTIEKTRYYPFSKKYVLVSKSIFDDPIPDDLGRIPLLSEVKTNAVLLTWEEYPTDLDGIIINPDGSETSCMNRKTYYSIVDIDDTSRIWT